MEFLKTIAISAIGIFPGTTNLPIGPAFACLLVAYIITVLTSCIIRDHGVPPGPTGVPFLGYWPYIDNDNIHFQEIALKKQYGDIFSFRVTGKLYINLASIKRLREALVAKSDCFRERASGYNILAEVFKDGIQFSLGEKWQTIRKYFVSELRERGMTVFKQNTADVVDETIGSFIEELRKRSEKPVEITQLLTSQCNLIIRQTLFGLNTTVSEEEVNKIQEDYKIVTSLFNSSSMLLHGKYARFFIANFQPFYEQALKVHKDVTMSIQKMIDDHRRTLDGENVRDIIDTYIRERDLRRAEGDPTYEYFSDDTLVSCLLMFVGDGVVSVATFITVILKALLTYPEEQEKIYKELMEVCGEDRNPTLADKSKLRYFNAFLLEAQRTANLFPPFPSLECTRETAIGGYRIPKGAITVINVYAIHNDPKEYENPEKFKPSRFLATDNKPKEESPITFGVGKRVCIGESFVLMQAFVFIAAIVKNFKISYPESRNDFKVTSRNLDVCVTPRK